MIGSCIQRERVCFFCGAPYPLERHHCLHGTANRKLADKYGLTVWLCKRHHEEVHRNADTDLILKQRAQIAFEHQYGDRNDFLRVFGRSYIFEGNDADGS